LCFGVGKSFSVVVEKEWNGLAKVHYSCAAMVLVIRFITKVLVSVKDDSKVAARITLRL
jgi:hypothetical protein